MTLRTLAMTLVLCALSGAQMLPFPGPTAPSAVSGASFALVDKTIASVTNAATTATITMPGGAMNSGQQLLIMLVGCIDAGCSVGTPPTGTGPTGAIASTGSPFSNSGSGTFSAVYVWLVPAAPASNQFTITLTSPGLYYGTVYASTWTGLETSTPFNTPALPATIATAATTYSITTAAPSDAARNSIVVGLSWLYDSVSTTPGSGFTEMADNGTGAELEYKEVAGGGLGAQTCTATFAAQGGPGAASCVVIKKAN